MKKIAVIGAGWYGCHIARVLKLKGYDVTLIESGDDIFRGISGKFGIRLHVGPHYPRSDKTRKSCREGFAEFAQTYPDLIVKHAYSIYALGKSDANNEPPKIDLKTFSDVAKEVKSREINPSEWGYSNLQSAFDVEEPSILVGNLLREKFRTYLHNAGVKIIYNFKINELVKKNTKVIAKGDIGSGIFDFVVNTTSYQALLPAPEPSLPYDLNIIYQPCLALVYEDRLSQAISLPPFSFIVMDGWFPCMMPYVEDTETTYRKYILTHGKYTIMGSFKTVEEANACLAKIDEEFIATHVLPKCESEMERHWPLFDALMPASTERRFKYLGWKSAVLAKVKSNREFRSAITFERDSVIHIIPGKVSNIFDAARETMALIENQNVLRKGAYNIVKDGALHEAVGEITEAIDPKIRNTGNLQTYAEIIDRLKEEKTEMRKEKITKPESIKKCSLAKLKFSIIPQLSSVKNTNSLTEASDHKIQIRSAL